MAIFKSPSDPMRNRAAMIDLETTDTKESAAIISIGALIFDPYHLDTTKTIHRYSFYEVIDMTTCMAAGLTSSADTIKWWSEQSDEARIAYNKAITGDGAPLNHVLNRLRRFFEGNAPPTTVWARSPDFDCKILEHACKKTEERFPFSFWQYRCCRTIGDLAWPNGDAPTLRTGTAHNAFDDCVTQALMVQQGHMRLGLCQTWDKSYDAEMKEYGSHHWCGRCAEKYTG